MTATTRSSSLSQYGFFDVALGAAVIIVALAFLAFMQVTTGTGKLGSYELTVQLADAGGLKIGSDVRLSGMKVGSVSDLSLGPQQRFALVQIAVRDDLKLPAGSTFSVIIEPMSDPYLSIRAGQGTSVIPQGSLVGKPDPARRQAPGV